MKVLLFRLITTACLLTYACQAQADSTFIKFGASWKYFDNGTDPGAEWKNVSSPGTESWPSGPAKFGYNNSDARTYINYGGNTARKYTTTYFRTSLNVPNTSLFSFFKLKVYLDDGMIVYVNGKEVCRSNMGGGVINYNSLASAETPDHGNITTSIKIPSGNFVNGINYIAVEVHQGSLKSEDLTFDLELTGMSKQTPTEIIRGPLLQMVSGDAITIVWKTSDNVSSKIQYGTSENLLVSSVKNDSLSTNHELRITGLQPDTKYYYSVGANNDILAGSYRTYFTTSPPANTTRKIRIGVFGDAGSGNLHQRNVRNKYLQLYKKGASAELAIMLGDNAYNFGSDREYQTNFFDAYDENIFDNHVVFPIPGNHEYYTQGVPYYSVFSLPTAGESGGLASGTESYYSFNYGNIHFVMLNSMGQDNGTSLSDSTGAQAEWLKKDLAADAGKHKWTIACLHHPPYTNGTHWSDWEQDLTAIRQQITPILERFGVDAVLAGHSHVYERSFLIQGHTGLSKTFKASSPGTGGNLVNGSSARYDGSTNSCPYFTIDTIARKGTVYVVAGSAGQIGGGTNADMPLFYYKNYSGSSGGESGVLYLEVQDNRLDAKFLGLSGVVRDQFTIMKGVNIKKNITVEINKEVDLTASWVGNYNWLPEPPVGAGGARTITVKPARIDKYTYYVKDSIGSKTCITDTFEIQASAATPVSSVKFEARQKYNTVLSKWSVEKDANIAYFTLERSSNAMDFNILNMVKAAISSNSSGPFLTVSTAITYEFEDNYPLQGNSYYRLKKTNKSGQTVILGVRSVDYKALRSFTYTIKSNATNKNAVTIAIESSRKQLLKIKMFDMTGKMVYYENFTATPGTNDIKVSLPSGIYVLNIIDPENIMVADKVVVR
ncbi:MAG: metallophosphoesterase [Chitinophagaceae bacterium]